MRLGAKFTTAITRRPSSSAHVYLAVNWADDRRVPISGPKSIVSLKAGFRASGNGSAAVMRPTRMSILSKSAIDAVAALGS